MANVNIELNIAGERVYFTIQNRLKYIAQKSKKVSIDRGRTARDGQKPGQKPFFWKPARTPGQGHKKRTCPGKPGRMVTLAGFIKYKKQVNKFGNLWNYFFNRIIE